MNITGEIYLIITNLFFSSLGIFSRELDKELPLISQVSFRLIAATIIYFIIFSRKNSNFLKLSKKDFVMLFVAGFFGYGLMIVFVVLSFLNTSYGNSTTFLQLTAIFVVIFSWLFLKEKIKVNSFIATILSLAGILIVFRPDFSNLDLGILYALIASFFYSFYFIIIRKVRKIDIKTRQFYTTFFGGFFLLPLVFLFESPIALGFSLKSWLIILLTAFLNIGGLFFLNKGLRLVEANIAGIISVSQALFGIGISYLVYNETLSKSEIFGATLILSSIVVLNLDLNSIFKVSTKSP